MHYSKHVLTRSTNVGRTLRRAFSRNIHLFMNAISDKLVDNMSWPFMSTVCDEKYRYLKYFMSLHPLKNK